MPCCRLEVELRRARGFLAAKSRRQANRSGAVNPCPLASSVQRISVGAVTADDDVEGLQYHALPTDDPLRALNILREAAGLQPVSDELDDQGG